MYPLILIALKRIRDLESKLLNEQLTRDQEADNCTAIHLSPNSIEKTNIQSSSLVHSSVHEVRYKLLFKLPRFTFGVISQILVYMTVTFLQPTLAIHLTSFGYKELFVGLSFALPIIVYVVTCSFIYKLTKIYKKSGVIFMGYGITSIGMLLVGPSQMLGLIDSEIITMVGLCIMGLGNAMIIIPVMPDMIEAAET
jgi:hypothetical protein